jgi:hypothetical protein
MIYTGNKQNFYSGTISVAKKKSSNIVVFAFTDICFGSHALSYGDFGMNSYTVVWMD